MKRECYGVNWGLWNVQIHQHLKAKQSKNRRKSKRHGKGKPHSRGKHGPPRPWAHHGLTVAATTGRGGHCGGCPVVFPQHRILVFLVHRLGPRGLPFLGVFWASSCYHLLILMALTSLSWIHLKHFSQNLGLNHRNLQ